VAVAGSWTFHLDTGLQIDAVGFAYVENRLTQLRYRSEHWISERRAISAVRHLREANLSGHPRLMAFRRREPEQRPPEALFDPSKIDLVSISADGSETLLHIVNDSPWTGSDDQVESLQSKIHNYVSFALDGQMHAAYPESVGLGWKIVINDQAGPPDARTANVISKVAQAVKRYGGDLVLK
jgi:hypothetical protein